MAGFRDFAVLKVSMADDNNVFAERLRKRLRDLGIDNEKEFAERHGLKPSSEEEDPGSYSTPPSYGRRP